VPLVRAEHERDVIALSLVDSGEACHDGVEQCLGGLVEVALGDGCECRREFVVLLDQARVERFDVDHELGALLAVGR